MKTYIKPTFQVVNIENESVLAGSDVNIGISSQSLDGTSALGRGRGGRYDEEEEEWD